MDDQGPSGSRDRSQRGRPGERFRARRGYQFPRVQHRHPMHGTQARRDNRQMPYVIGFIVVVGVLALLLYVGLNWATSPEAAALANPPTPTPIPVATATPPQPSPTVVEQTYIVKAGDNPASIAAQFGIRTDDLIAANNIDDPQKLQIGQALKIPPPASSR